MSGSAEILTFKPGTVLQVQVGSHNGKPTYSEYSHEEILGILARSNRKASGVKKTSVNKVSRVIGLLCRSIIKGTWSTGAPINVPAMYDKLIGVVNELGSAEYDRLTPHARSALASFVNNSDIARMYPSRTDALKEKLRLL